MKARTGRIILTTILAVALPVTAMSVVTAQGTGAQATSLPTKGCVVTEIGELNNGMEFYYNMTFCGKGISDQILTCPRKSYHTMEPYQIAVGCTVQYYPEGFPQWMSATGLVPVGY